MLHDHDDRRPFGLLISGQLLSVSGQRVIVAPGEDEILLSRRDDGPVGVGEHREESHSELPDRINIDVSIGNGRHPFPIDPTERLSVVRRAQFGDRRSVKRSIRIAFAETRALARDGQLERRGVCVVGILNQFAENDEIGRVSRQDFVH